MSDTVEVPVEALDGLVLASLKRQHAIVAGCIEETQAKLLTCDEAERAYLRQTLAEDSESLLLLTKVIDYYGGTPYDA